MAMHCRSGGDIEVMGLMQGKVAGDTFIVIDTFALPVEGESQEFHLVTKKYTSSWWMHPVADLPLLMYNRDRNTCQRTKRSVRIHGGIHAVAEGFWKARKRCGMVPLTPWIWLLALRNRCLNPDVEPDVSRTFSGNCNRPHPHSCSRESGNRCVSDLPPRRETTGRNCLRVPDHTVE